MQLTGPLVKNINLNFCSAQSLSVPYTYITIEEQRFPFICLSLSIDKIDHMYDQEVYV